MTVAQQVDAQSAELSHWPPMNWMPWPLPTFLAPAGSGEMGLARAGMATMDVLVMRRLGGKGVLYRGRDREGR